MFKFGFSKDKEENVDEPEDTLSSPALEIEVSKKFFEKVLEFELYEFDVLDKFPGVTFYCVPFKRSLEFLKLNDRLESDSSISEAESHKSDLIPGKYEGGLKIWECSYDLGQYLTENIISLENKRVLDLGCGAGIIGLLAITKKAEVHFQDYNEDVIIGSTIPNIILNVKDHEYITNKCKFYSGDWRSFNELLSENSNEKYDIILTSETIYNPNNYEKLYNIFKDNLNLHGFVYIAAKIYYFGIGGGMRQFEDFIKKDNIFTTDIVWKCQEGLHREILRLKRIN